MPISEIERTFTANPYYSVGAGYIRGFADYARLHLAAAFDITDVFLHGQGPSAKDVKTLLAQLETGIPATALELLDLPIQLGRGTYLALHQAGFVRPSDVWAATEERLLRLVGAAVAATIWAVRPGLEPGGAS